MTFEHDEGAPHPPKTPLWRRTWNGLRGLAGGPSTTAAPSSFGRLLWRWSWRIVVLVIVLYYPLGSLIVEDIDDDPQFKPVVTAGESRAVAIAAQLVTREVDIHSWTPMQPFFMPSGLLDNMPNFQRGMMAALGRFATELWTRSAAPAAPARPTATSSRRAAS